MSWKHTLWVGTAAVCGLCAFAEGTVFRVDASSQVMNATGSNWNGDPDTTPPGDCIARLSDALALAQSGDEIWIAQGIYHPDELSPGDPNQSFMLNPGVKVYGGYKGYAGFDTGDADVRDPMYVTILSGDLDENDDPDPSLPLNDDINRAENSHTVVLIKSGELSVNTKLDGVTVRDGNGGSIGLPDNGGAGVLVEFKAWPTISNCKFTRNGVGDGSYGGAILLLGGHLHKTQVEDCEFDDNEAGTGGAFALLDHSYLDPGRASISRCEFSDNRATYVGGGAMLVGTAASLTVTDTLVQDNEDAATPNNGGGGGGGLLVWKSADATVQRCQFIGNQVDNQSGATLIGGGAILAYEGATLVAVDSLFHQNTILTPNNSYDAGGAAAHISGGSNDCSFTNCVFEGNNAQASSAGGVLVEASASASFVNCLMTGNTGWTGGAIFSRGTANVTNCTIAGNSAESRGGCAWSGQDADGFLTNSILWGNTDSDNNGTDDLEEQVCVDAGSGCLSAPSNVTIAYSDFYDGDPSDNSHPFASSNIDSDPLFVGSGDYPYQLSLDSPCIDAGDNSPPPENEFPSDDYDVDQDTVYGEPTPDLKYDHRIVFGDNGEVGNDECDPIVDMGAFEVTENTGEDCNANGIVDTCDLLDHPEFDCNSNNIIDTCELVNDPELDCNGNNIIDSCEVQTEAGTRVLYVDDDASPSGTGDSWETAGNSLQKALYIAEHADLCNRVGEIRVAQGSYRADYGPEQTPDDRSASFHLLPFVAIRGGYAGVGAPNPNARDVTKYKSALNGDIGVVGDSSDNTEHVVVADSVDETAILDGFVITNGYTDTEGGGVRVVNGSATISNCYIAKSQAYLGGGMYCFQANPVVVNCRFVSNASYLGAGMSNWAASPIVTNCLFDHNTGLEQGDGGGGAMYNTYGSAAVTNCTFSDNSSDFPGVAIWNDFAGGVTVTNCILWGNKEDCGSCSPDEAELYYSGESGTDHVTYSCIHIKDDVDYPGTGNINKDPKFQDQKNFRLSSGSSCIDVGDNTQVPADAADLDRDDDTSEVTPLDFDLNKRFADDAKTPDNGNGTAPIVDMGCYEFEAPGMLMGGSGRSHGAAGEYMVPPDSVECRSINGTLTFQFIYDRPVYSEDGDAFTTADFTAANANVDSVVQSPELDTIEVTCSGVANESCVGLSFVVESGAGDEFSGDYVWQVLEGDVNGDGIVDKYDEEAIRKLDGEVPTKDEYRCDLDGDGVIEGSNASPIGDDYAMAVAADGDAVGSCGAKLTSMVSRKTHKETYYDIDNGQVEPRGGNMNLVFTFDREIQSTDGDAFTASDFTISSGTIVSVKPVKQWDQFIVEVENVADEEVFTVSFDAEDTDGFPLQVEACWPVLLGDVDGNGEVDSADESLVLKDTGAAVNASNFREDLDMDGTIEGASPATDDLDICIPQEGNEVGACGG